QSSMHGPLARKIGPEAVEIDDKLRLSDEREGKADDYGLGLAIQLDLQMHFIAGHVLDHASETLPAVDRLLELHLRFVTCPQRKVARADQRPVDAGRGDLEIVVS